MRAQWKSTDISRTDHQIVSDLLGASAFLMPGRKRGSGVFSKRFAECKQGRSTKRDAHRLLQIRTQPQDGRPTTLEASRSGLYGVNTPLRS